MRIGYTMMCEQADPRQLVRDVVRAEELGFDFAVIYDHYHPWLTSQGHSGYAWSALFAGGYFNYRGLHFDVDSAKLWDARTSR